ncbi:hypothetical protein [Sphingobacterium cellulitidis]|uniref:hypothetical protein n=1 Tax=Sphingobacterium cellulitidis TaxID=1768011 RepID=UPI000B9417CE|nr:hypothetical protein CHT99_15480 [Sphingobacterium cellulitidis]
MKKNLLFYGSIFLFFIVLLNSCNKYEIFEKERLDPELIELQKQFYLKQTEFFKNGIKVSYNYRQSMERTIDWSNAVKKNDKTFVPVVLKLPQQIRNKDGSQFFNKKVWLEISNLNDTINYVMYTLIPDSNKNISKFSGQILVEDYFIGNVGITYIKDGNLDKDKIKSKVIIGNKTNKSRNVGNKALIRFQVCETVVLGWHCVDGLNGSSDAPICGFRTETVCDIIDLPDMPEIPGGGGENSGGGSTGSGNNSNLNNKIPAIVDTSLLDSIDLKDLNIGFNEMEESCIYKKMLELFPSTAKFKIDLDDDYKLNYNKNDTLVTGTKGSFQHAEYLAHEVFHAFQDLAAYDSFKFGKTTYTDPTTQLTVVEYSPGYINVEFERMVFQDIAKYYQHPIFWRDIVGKNYYISNNSVEIIEKYRDFISVLANKKDEPQYFQSREFEQLYFNQLSLWKNNTTLSYNKSEIATDLKPMALKLIFNSGIDCN